MKTNLIKTLAMMGWLSYAAIATSAEADKAPGSVTFNSGKVMIPDSGKSVEAIKEVTLPGDVLVKTNGAFTVAKGATRQLLEGQTIDSSGMLSSPDGSVMPVVDHLVLRQGKVRVVKDGQGRVLTAEFSLPDGARVAPDGGIRGRDGRLRRMLDGQLLKLDGTTVEVTDTISLKGGKVVLFKDGGRVDVRRGQVIAMSDGTRVSGDGFITRPDGTRTTLKEGDTLKVPGVIAPRR